MSAPTKLIGGFFLRLLLLYAGLMLLWPVAGPQYARFFHGFGNTLFSEFGDRGRVHFGVNPEQGETDQDTHVQLTNRRTGVTGGIYYISRHGYATTAITLALILATPTAWRRRGLATFWGLLLIHGFIALRLWVGLLAVFSGTHPLAIRQSSEFGRTILELAQRILITSPEATYVAPVFIWIVVCLRRRDINAWRAILPAETSPQKHAKRD